MTSTEGAPAMTRMTVDTGGTLHAACAHCGRAIFRPGTRSFWVHDHNDSPACLRRGGTQATPDATEEEVAAAVAADFAATEAARVASYRGLSGLGGLR